MSAYQHTDQAINITENSTQNNLCYLRGRFWISCKFPQAAWVDPEISSQSDSVGRRTWTPVKKSLYPHFNRNSSDVPGALAVRSVPPTTAIGKTKLDKNGIAKRKDNIAPKPVHA